MKKLFYLIIFVISQVSIFPQAFEWEWQNSKPNGNDFTDICFLTDTKVIAFGGASSILISTNNGDNWQLSYIDTLRRDIWNSYFLDANTGFICGEGGLLMKTTDGGTTWIYKNSGTSNVLYDIEFINSNSGLAVGGAGTILRTTDGGETWSAGASGSSSHYKVSIVNSDIVYIGSSSSTTGRLLKSTDFGSTWSNVTPAAVSSSVYGMYVMSSTTYYISTGLNGILITTDSGTTWTIQQASGNTIYDVKFMNSTTGFATESKGVVYKTTDGGSNWTPLQLTSTKALRAVDFSTGLFVCGNSGNLFRSTDNGNSWDPKFSTVTQDYIRKIYFKTALNGWAVGGSSTTADSIGFILQTTNGGVTWNKNPYNFKAQVYSISMPSDNVWYVGRGANKIFKTTDAGVTFTELSHPITSATNVFWFIGFANDSVGYAGGNSGKVIKTTNGGASWTDISTNAGFSTSTIYDIAVFSPDTIILSGLSAKLKKTTDGGATAFTTLSPGIAGNFFAVRFKDSNFGMVAGSALGAAVTTDGGSTWTPSALPSSLSSTTSMWAIGFGDSHIWLSSGNGDILYSSDAGLNFTEARKPTTNVLDGIAIIGDDMWIAGNGGVIIKGYSDPNVPVELLTFTGAKSGNSILLKWSTATETNNRGFEIQKKNSASNWENIGFIRGKGTSTVRSDYSFQDKNPYGNSNTYRLKQIDFDGTFKYFNTITVDFGSPVSFELGQNYPNPFNPVTTISYSVRSKENVELKIYNILGKEVRTLVNQIQEPGNYQISLNAEDLPTGVYFYKMQAGSFTAVKKMILLK